MIEINAGKLRQVGGGAFLKEAYVKGEGLIVSRGPRSGSYDLYLLAIGINEVDDKRNMHITPRELYAGTIKAASDAIDKGVTTLYSRGLCVAFEMSLVSNFGKS